MFTIAWNIHEEIAAQNAGRECWNCVPNLPGLCRLLCFSSRKMLLHMMAATGQSVSSFTQGEFLEMLPVNLDLRIWLKPRGPWQSCQAVLVLSICLTSLEHPPIRTLCWKIGKSLGAHCGCSKQHQIRAIKWQDFSFLYLKVSAHLCWASLRVFLGKSCLFFLKTVTKARLGTVINSTLFLCLICITSTNFCLEEILPLSHIPVPPALTPAGWC